MAVVHCVHSGEFLLSESSGALVASPSAEHLAKSDPANPRDVFCMRAFESSAICQTMVAELFHGALAESTDDDPADSPIRMRSQPQREVSGTILGNVLDALHHVVDALRHPMEAAPSAASLIRSPLMPSISPRTTSRLRATSPSENPLSRPRTADLGQMRIGYLVFVLCVVRELFACAPNGLSHQEAAEVFLARVLGGMVRRMRALSTNEGRIPPHRAASGAVAALIEGAERHLEGVIGMLCEGRQSGDPVPQPEQVMAMLGLNRDATVTTSILPMLPTELFTRLDPTRTVETDVNTGTQNREVLQAASKTMIESRHAQHMVLALQSSARALRAQLPSARTTPAASYFPPSAAIEPMSKEGSPESLQNLAVSPIRRRTKKPGSEPVPHIPWWVGKLAKHIQEKEEVETRRRIVNPLEKVQGPGPRRARSAMALHPPNQRSQSRSPSPPQWGPDSDPQPENEQPVKQAPPNRKSAPSPKRRSLVDKLRDCLGAGHPRVSGRAPTREESVEAPSVQTFVPAETNSDIPDVAPTNLRSALEEVAHRMEERAAKEMKPKRSQPNHARPLQLTAGRLHLDEQLLSDERSEEEIDISRVMDWMAETAIPATKLSRRLSGEHLSLSHQSSSPMLGRSDNWDDPSAPPVAMNPPRRHDMSLEELQNITQAQRGIRRENQLATEALNAQLHVQEQRYWDHRRSQTPLFDLGNRVVVQPQRQGTAEAERFAGTLQMEQLDRVGQRTLQTPPELVRSRPELRRRFGNTPLFRTRREASSTPAQSQNTAVTQFRRHTPAPTGGGFSNFSTFR